MRILEHPASGSKKFGSKRADHGDKNPEKERQLNLFSVGRILQLHPHSPFEKALKMDENGNVAAAKSLYHKAVEADDMPADAYCNLGILESQAGNTAKAINYLTLSLKHNPRHLEAHFNLANLFVEVGNLDLGILHYEVCTEIKPEFSNSYFNLGLCLAEADRYDEAIEVFDKYCRLVSPEEREPAMELIEKLRAMG
ncbi:MAG TPA: tetratricopeptide repeat protein [Balneolaceae bacterium]